MKIRCLTIIVSCVGVLFGLTQSISAVSTSGDNIATASSYYGEEAFGSNQKNQDVLYERRGNDYSSRTSLKGGDAESASSSSSSAADDRRRRTTTTSRSRRRRLPGSYDFMDGKWASGEAGFAAGFVALLVLLCLLMACCCCGFSCWDLLAMVCIWEICCDGAGVGDFAQMV